MNFFRSIKTSLALSFFLFSALTATGFAFEVKPEQYPKELDQAKARVFIYRHGDKILGIKGFGADVNVGGKTHATLSLGEFDVSELPVGDIDVELSQRMSLEVCRVKLKIDPLKDNFLRIQERNVGFARKFIFNSVLVQALEREACAGLNEIVKVSEDEARDQISKSVYTPTSSPIDSKMSREKICGFLGGSKDTSCNPTVENIRNYSPVSYVQKTTNVVASSGVVQTNVSQLTNTNMNVALIQCKVGENPVIEIDAKSCLAVKGIIIDADIMRCRIGNNEPIKLSPDLCIQGSGTVLR
jgi:hypothetical protein